MTVSTTKASDVFPGNGSSGPFDCEWRIFDDADVLVSLVDQATGGDTPLTLNTDYTISGAGDQAGFTVATVSPVANGTSLYVRRAIAYKQPTDFTNQGSFFPTMHEDAMDRLEMQIQQQVDGIDRALKANAVTESYESGGRRVTGAADAVDGNDLTTLQQVSAMVAGAASGIVPSLIVKFSDLIASTGAALVGFIQSGTGAVIRTIMDKLRERPSVVDYGADPTGVADSTASFNKAIAAHDDVYVPPGTYKLTDAVSIASGKRLYGAGRRKTTLLMDATFNAAALGALVFTGGEPGPTVEHLKITQTQPDSTAATVYPPCIYAQSSPRFALRCLRLSCVYAGIDMKGNSGGAVIDDIDLAPLSIGIDIDGSLDSVKISKLHLWPFDLTTNQRTSYTAAYGIKSGRCDDFHLSDSLLFSMINAAYFYNSASGRTFGNIVNVDFDDRGGLNVAAGDLCVAACVFTQGKSDAWLIHMTGGTLSVGASRFRGDVINASANGFIEIAAGDVNFSASRMDGLSNNTPFVYMTNANVNVTGCRINRAQNVAYTTAFIRAATNAKGSITGNSCADLGTGSSKFIQIDNDYGLLVRGNAMNGWTVQVPSGALSNTAIGGNLGAGSNKDEFAGYFSSDASTTVKLPSGWSVSRAAAGVYVLTHNLGLAVASDMIPSVNADNTTSGCFAVVDASGSTTSTVKIRTYVGTTLTDSGVFFSLRRYRS